MVDRYIRDFIPDHFDTKIVNKNELENILEAKKEVTFNILHTNIRSVAKNFDELKIFLSNYENQFDCIVSTETFKITDTSLDQLGGYNLLYNEGEINKNDGVIIYVKNNVNFT